MISITSRPNPEPVRRATARIRHVNGNVVGAGFLISESCLLTCAHVVTEALGLPQTTSQAPANLIDLDLIAHDDTFCPLQARIVFWSPICPGKRGEDIAGLQLVGEIPQGFQPVTLETADDWWKHSFGTFGFPKGYDLGTWAHGELLGARGGDGWVQMEGIRVQGHPIQPGFSGSPIWDESLDSVIGMAVAADRKRDTQTAYMIPAEILTDATEALSLIELLLPFYRTVDRSIKAAFNACCPKNWSGSKPKALPAMIAELQDMPQGDAPFSRILQFVARLATAVPDINQQLQDWAISQGHDWQALLEQIQPAQAVSQISYLFIRVEDTKPKSKEYILSALFAPEHTADNRWNWRCRQLIIPSPPSEQSGFKLDEIPAGQCEVFLLMEGRG
ncbi:MAG: trypsin-like peptidase domain-containing protein [Elainella sp. C42_A2020_010]|nr:trypsin-like peptidase domain-containing protein [Elainella sp. C42_A2020_010]